MKTTNMTFKDFPVETMNYSMNFMIEFFEKIFHTQICKISYFCLQLCCVRDYLEESKCTVIALKDLDKYFNIGDVDDPALKYTVTSE